MALAAPSHAQNDPQQNSQAAPAEQTHPQPNPPLPITITGPVRVEREKEVEPDWNKLKCNEAKSHDEADLCEQRRMAKAAEDSVYLNGIQVGVGVVGAAMLLWTLYYTRKATRAAVEAAGAANTQAEAALHANRAWITNTSHDIAFGQGTFNDVPNVNILHLALRWTNGGNTPALRVNMVIQRRVTALDAPAPHFPLPDMPPDARSAPIGPGQSVASARVAFSDAEHKAFVERRTSIYLYCRVSYFDIYFPTRERISEACLRVVYLGHIQGQTTVGLVAAGPQNTAS